VSIFTSRPAASSRATLRLTVIEIPPRGVLELVSAPDLFVERAALHHL